MNSSQLKYRLKDGFSTPFKGQKLVATQGALRLDLDDKERIQGAVLGVMFNAESMTKLKAAMPILINQLPDVATPYMELSLEADFSKVTDIMSLQTLVKEGILDLNNYSFLRAQKDWVEM